LSGIANSIRLPEADNGPWGYLAHVRPNKAFKLTRSQKAWRHCVPPRLGRPSQLNAMFSRRLRVHSRRGGGLLGRGGCCGVYGAVQ
jgi:hypothetical protein